MSCKICSSPVCTYAKAKIMPQQFDAHYLVCNHCEYVFIDKPHWLHLAYKESITDSDIGLVSRNLKFSIISFSLIKAFFNFRKKFLDFAGGYGLFVRLSRDLGLDFYWTDKYTKNLFAKEFALNNSEKSFEMVTAFEVLEHLENPIAELEKMFRLSENILLSTELLPSSKPLPHEWNYFALEHGQHIAFFSLKTLQYIANKYSYNLYTNNFDIHLLTRKKIPNILFKIIIKYKVALLIRYIFKLPSLQSKDQKQIEKKRPDIKY